MNFLLTALSTGHDLGRVHHDQNRVSRNASNHMLVVLPVQTIVAEHRAPISTSTGRSDVPLLRVTAVPVFQHDTKDLIPRCVQRGFNGYDCFKKTFRRDRGFHIVAGLGAQNCSAWPIV